MMFAGDDRLPLVGQGTQNSAKKESRGSRGRFAPRLLAHFFNVKTLPPFHRALQTYTMKLKP